MSIAFVGWTLPSGLARHAKFDCLRGVEMAPSRQVGKCSTDRVYSMRTSWNENCGGPELRGDGR